MIFAIMLTRDITQGEESQFNSNVIIAGFLGIVIFAALSVLIINSRVSELAYPPLDSRMDFVSELGVALVSPNAFIIPFELASVLLLAALIGAIIIAWKK
jgi:NADH-quinone oxidoreductase subunit J